MELDCPLSCSVAIRTAHKICNTGLCASRWPKSHLGGATITALSKCIYYRWIHEWIEPGFRRRGERDTSGEKVSNASSKSSSIAFTYSLSSCYPQIIFSALLRKFHYSPPARARGDLCPLVPLATPMMAVDGKVLEGIEGQVK